MHAPVRQIEITAMTFGPYGVAHLDGKTVLTPNSAPGDILDAQIVAQHRDYATARLQRVVRSGSARREPPCSYLPRCGGCDWQQIEYAEQVRLKAGLIVAEFRRTLAIELDPDGLVRAAPAEFGYRGRIRLKTAASGRLGYFELGSKTIVAIDHCMVASPTIRLPNELARALRRLCREIEVVASAGREVLVAWLAREPGPGDIAKASRIVDEHGWIAGLILRSRASRKVIGDVRIGVEVEPQCTIECDADLFSQVNRQQNRALVADVMESAGAGPGMRMLDLFCGAGNFSLPSARRGAEVIGVDTDKLATTAARDNASRMDLHNAQFIAMGAAETANFLARAQYRPEVIIMDPPRTGAFELIDPIVKLQARKLIYVSCDPSTLVRDLRRLIARGYKIERVRGFDFFPNTHHVEVAVSALLT